MQNFIYLAQILFDLIISTRVKIKNNPYFKRVYLGGNKMQSNRIYIQKTSIGKEYVLELYYSMLSWLSQTHPVFDYHGFFDDFFNSDIQKEIDEENNYYLDKTPTQMLTEEIKLDMDNYIDQIGDSVLYNDVYATEWVVTIYTEFSYTYHYPLCCLLAVFPLSKMYNMYPCYHELSTLKVVMEISSMVTGKITIW